MLRELKTPRFVVWALIVQLKNKCSNTLLDVSDKIQDVFLEGKFRMCLLVVIFIFIFYLFSATEEKFLTWYK